MKRAVLLLLSCTTAAWADEIHQAASACNPPHMRDLLLKRPSLTETDESGRTPLHIAIDSRHTECVRLLLAAGADPNAKDKKGRTASDTALANRPSDFADTKAVKDWGTMVALVKKMNQDKSVAPATQSGSQQTRRIPAN